MLDLALEPLAKELVKADLLSSGQLNHMIQHAAGFPRLPFHRIFLEYRIDSDLLLEGYGHGFTRGVLESIVSDQDSFPAASKIAKARSSDPFASDRRKYLDLYADSDPEWIEYDYHVGGFSSEPAVFFSFPARFRTWKSPSSLPLLEEALRTLMPRRSRHAPSDSEFMNAHFIDFLQSILEPSREQPQQALELYRLGLSEFREPGWARIVLSGIPSNSVSTCLVELFGQQQHSVKDLIGEERNATEPRSSVLTASLSMQDGDVVAMDIEYPYFHRIRSDCERREAVRSFCHFLEDRYHVSTPVLSALMHAAVLPITIVDHHVEGRLLLNHFKFGVGGYTRGRIKVYFELLLRITT